MEDNKNLYIVRSGEAALKGQNKPYFERMLAGKIKKVLKGLDGLKIERSYGLIFIQTDGTESEDEVSQRVCRVFGVASISKAWKIPAQMDAICQRVPMYVNELIKSRFGESVEEITFKVKSKRADKNFPIKSPDIARIVGGSVLKAIPSLKVDVHNPMIELYVDVRNDGAYLYCEKTMGLGGLPIGTNGKGMVLLSGGIDSPVAAWMMAKRGMDIEAVHFHSYPYTSERAYDKVKELAEKLAIYCGSFKLHSINLLKAQQAIMEGCPSDEMTILTRRFMMKIAERIGVETQCHMLITGESLGQVASQTAQSIVATDGAVTMPVARPLIGIDKVDIMDMAKMIDTYEISIKPFEDCCTVFLPKHPVTKPKVESIERSEAKIDVEGIIEELLGERSFETIF